MNYDNKMSVKFSANTENVSFARLLIAAFILPMDPTVEEVSDIKLAVSEAVTNAIIHGYNNNQEGSVYVDCRYKDKKIYIEIRDKGVGIENIEEARQPLFTSKPEDERAGLGFTIMETFMDDIHIESTPNCGTKILMEKNIGEPPIKSETE